MSALEKTFKKDFAVFAYEHHPNYDEMLDKRFGDVINDVVLLVEMYYFKRKTDEEWERLKKFLEENRIK